MSRVIVFDVNETLLDLKALDPFFEQRFGNTLVRRLWFSQMLQMSLLVTITQQYTPFDTLGAAALDMVAARQNVTISAGDREEIVELVHRLPAHPDVVESLERLRDAGLRLATLTNSSTQMVQRQLTYAGVIDYFEEVLSVDRVQRFKPAAEVYHMAAASLGIDTGHMRLVAAHDWDVTGAMLVGCAGAFVARPGAVLNPLAPLPDIIGPDLWVVTDRILEIELADEGER